MCCFPSRRGPPAARARARKGSHPKGARVQKAQLLTTGKGSSNISNFLADLAQGEAAEARVGTLLGGLYPQCTFIKANKASKYMDLLCTEHGEAVEVKTDRKALTTGNVCFEANLFIYSKAKHVIYLIGNTAYVWDIEDLKLELLVQHAHGKTKGMLGGDGWRNPLIIVPIEIISKTAETHELEGE